jgi:hypothetical protein
MNLRADLADPLVSSNCISDSKTLAYVKRHWLLQVNVLARPAGIDRHATVPVGGCGDDHSINVFGFQHLTVVVVWFGSVLVLSDYRIPAGLPDVTGTGDDYIRRIGAVLQIASAHASTTD